jgi:arginyl-tRNA synthetase
MILSLQRTVHDAIVDAIRRHYAIADPPAFAVEVPPTRALGDLAVPVAFQLARTLRKAPRAIAQELAAAAGAIPGVERIVATPNGYLNLYLDRAAFIIPRIRQQVAAAAGAPEKTIVEHTAINPNKAAHIGHLRNAALGDTLVRALRFRGTPFETQNYIDDMGVQVADIVVGFRELEHRSLDEVREIADTTRFDYYCWDLYSRVTEYSGDRRASRFAAGRSTTRARRQRCRRHGRLHRRRDRARAPEDDGEAEHRLRPADLRGRHPAPALWAHAFEVLKAKGAVFLQTEGKLAGCWVMRIEDGGGGAEARPEPADGRARRPTKAMRRAKGDPA